MKYTINKSHIFDVSIIIFLLFAGLVFPYLVRDSALDYSLVWYAILSLPTVAYLGLRERKNWKKIGVGSLVFGLLFGFLLEYFAHVTDTWVVPSTLFPFRILGFNTIESLFGYIFMTAYVLVFYEHFFDKDKNHRISPHIWRAIIPVFLVLVVVVFFHYTNPSKLFFTNAYLKMGLVAILPLILEVQRLPKLFRKYFPFALSLFPIIFTWEVVGLTFQYWTFPGQDYLAVVTFFSQSFPIEEIIFWMLLYPVTIASYYEQFVDDEK